MVVAVPADEPSDLAAIDTSSPDAPCRIWVDDASRFSTAQMSAIRHDYHRHPLMQLPELAKLAKDLYETGQCRFISPGATQSSKFDHGDKPHDGRTIEDVFRRIEEPGAWVALYNVETHPRYRKFLEEVVAGVKALVEPQEGPINSVGGFIFISAPPSVTPFHIDRENNFWLQVHGRKQMTVWDHRDREVVAQADVEQFLASGSLANVKLKESALARGTEFDCGPGDGVYFPSTSPHMTRSDPEWVRPGDGVSVSIGIVFYTEHTRRVANMQFANLHLRRLGLKPAEPGKSALGDQLRYVLGRSVVGVKKRVTGFKPKPGF